MKIFLCKVNDGQYLRTWAHSMVLGVKFYNKFWLILFKTKRYEVSTFSFIFFNDDYVIFFYFCHWFFSCSVFLAFLMTHLSFKDINHSHFLWWNDLLNSHVSSQIINILYTLVKQPSNHQYPLHPGETVFKYICWEDLCSLCLLYLWLENFISGENWDVLYGNLCPIKPCQINLGTIKLLYWAYLVCNIDLYRKSF